MSVGAGSVLRRGRAPGIAMLGSTSARRVLLTCGVAAIALYIGLDTVAAMLYDGYSYKSQTISELSAVGAPTRSLLLPLGIVFGALTIAFGYGIWASAGRMRGLRVVAGAVTTIGVLALVAWPFAPMHQREVLAAGGGTWQDSMHIALTMADAVLILASIAFAFTSFGKAFRVYSVATVVILLVSGALMGMEGKDILQNKPTPWYGVEERIIVFGSMLWFAVLAIVLLRVEASMKSRGIEDRA